MTDEKYRSVIGTIFLIQIMLFQQRNDREEIEVFGGKHQSSKIG